MLAVIGRGEQPGEVHSGRVEPARAIDPVELEQEPGRCILGFRTAVIRAEEPA